MIVVNAVRNEIPDECWLLSRVRTQPWTVQMSSDCSVLSTCCVLTMDFGISFSYLTVIFRMKKWLSWRLDSIVATRVSSHSESGEILSESFARSCHLEAKLWIGKNMMLKVRLELSEVRSAVIVVAQDHLNWALTGMPCMNRLCDLWWENPGYSIWNFALMLLLFWNDFEMNWTNQRLGFDGVLKWPPCDGLADLSAILKLNRIGNYMASWIFASIEVSYLMPRVPVETLLQVDRQPPRAAQPGFIWMWTLRIFQL